MISFVTRKRMINEYLKWIAQYSLSHTPDTFLEWLCILEYLDEDKIEEDMEGIE